MEITKQAPVKGSNITLESSAGSGVYILYTFDGERWTFVDSGGKTQREVPKRSSIITELFISGIEAHE